jgi:hypothetical protein
VEGVVNTGDLARMLSLEALLELLQEHDHRLTLQEGKQGVGAWGWTGWACGWCSGQSCLTCDLTLSAEGPRIDLRDALQVSWRRNGVTGPGGTRPPWPTGDFRRAS